MSASQTTMDKLYGMRLSVMPRRTGTRRRRTASPT